jgi:hypothetical protein
MLDAIRLRFDWEVWNHKIIKYLCINDACLSSSAPTGFGGRYLNLMCGPMLCTAVRGLPLVYNFILHKCLYCTLADLILSNQIKCKQRQIHPKDEFDVVYIQFDLIRDWLQNKYLNKIRYYILKVSLVLPCKASAHTPSFNNPFGFHDD